MSRILQHPLIIIEDNEDYSDECICVLIIKLKKCVGCSDNIATCFVILARGIKSEPTLYVNKIWNVLPVTHIFIYLIKHSSLVKCSLTEVCVRSWVFHSRHPLELTYTHRWKDPEIVVGSIYRSIKFLIPSAMLYKSRFTHRNIIPLPYLVRRWSTLTI